ncbi:hypothetical protein [Paenibacillus sedimenti]|uniref:Uncharacterized protein n=1 Tax=Paenibacillus sedimenti TaxID=2770274 RepID=A0A926KPA0_9BACL|nr:hypothetical protein [Paenibacillus sedimenti]MBD0380793.1 hypothetical protein [Paenibacillus sedimenti]
MMYQFFMIIASIVVIIILYKFAIKVRDKTVANKVIKFSLNKGRSSKANKKTCSFCKKKAKRLSFYATEVGGVVGVCDSCKPQAERRALLRL